VGRSFCMLVLEGDVAEREAAFRASNSVGPTDTLHIVSVTFAEPPPALEREIGKEGFASP
jgi:hypothetical protein